MSLHSGHEVSPWLVLKIKDKTERSHFDYVSWPIRLLSIGTLTLPVAEIKKSFPLQLHSGTYRRRWSRAIKHVNIIWHQGFCWDVMLYYMVHAVVFSLDLKRQQCITAETNIILIVTVLFCEYFSLQACGMRRFEQKSYSVLPIRSTNEEENW